MSIFINLILNLERSYTAYSKKSNHTNKCHLFEGEKKNLDIKSLDGFENFSSQTNKPNSSYQFF